MFINFSNHPYALWSAEQQAAAQRYGTVVDLAFPAIDPAADEAALEAAGIPTLAACSRRQSQETTCPDGSTLKRSIFAFAGFRRYGSP